MAAVAAIGAASTRAQPVTPAPVTILQNAGATADGFIFYTQQRGQAPGNGPVIMDTQGRPVWYLPLASGLAADFRVQTYRGQPVLTWAQGDSFQNVVPGTGVDYICDASYNVIATVRAGNGLNSDLHTFELTPQGTALITIYNRLPMDLSALGGPADGAVLEGVAQEIDVATGAVVFEWHSLDHVGLDESNGPPPTTAGSVYDYFHINSVTLDTDRNLLISARHTSAIYKVNRTTGAVIWRLGGKKSDFALGDGLPFAMQHNAVAVDGATIRMFDNEASAPTRILWVNHDDGAMTARVVRSILHPDKLFAFAEGSAQSLPNGNTMVGWGTAGAISEFDAQGNLVYDVRFAKGCSSYRTFRLPWVGHPLTDPTVTAFQHDDGTLTVHATWNGATEVAKWQVLGIGADGVAREVALTDWNGLDTAATIASAPDALQVVALDRNGVALGASATLAGPYPLSTPVVETQPVSQTIATGTSVVFSVKATDGSAYQWMYNGTPLAKDGSAAAKISGATAPVLVLRDTTVAAAGKYSCVVSNGSATATTMPAVLTVANTADIGRLVNVSCRSLVAGGENALIVGFVVGGGDGSMTQDLVLRASGPALTSFGVPGVLPDPRLDLYNLKSAGSPIAWTFSHKSNPSAAALSIGPTAMAAALDRGADATLSQTLSPAAYTAVVTSLTGSDGVALAEIDDATPPAEFSPTMPRLMNGSGRAQVGTGANTLVAGFVISGSTSRTVLIRAAGPALRSCGVVGALSDPQLQLYSSSGKLITSNSDWAGDVEIAATAAQVGAFPWGDPASKDAALLITLPPGAYTAQVSGANGGTGVALVEVYDAN